MTFTVTDLVAQFDPATYARGEAYASKGKVKRVQYANGRLEGEVEGSGGATYQQRIRIQADGGRSTIDGRCACPVARNCKHVVATLLFSLKQEQAALAGGVPAHAEQWMTQLSGAVQLAARQTPLGPLFQPLYVLIPDRTRAACTCTCAARGCARMAASTGRSAVFPRSSCWRRRSVSRRTRKNACACMQRCAAARITPPAPRRRQAGPAPACWRWPARRDACTTRRATPS